MRIHSFTLQENRFSFSLTFIFFLLSVKLMFLFCLNCETCIVGIGNVTLPMYREHFRSCIYKFLLISVSFFLFPFEDKTFVLLQNCSCLIFSSEKLLVPKFQHTHISRQWLNVLNFQHFLSQHMLMQSFSYIVEFHKFFFLELLFGYRISSFPEACNKILLKIRNDKRRNQRNVEKANWFDSGPHVFAFLLFDQSMDFSSSTLDLLQFLRFYAHLSIDLRTENTPNAFTWRQLLWINITSFCHITKKINDNLSHWCHFLASHCLLSCNQPEQWTNNASTMKCKHFIYVI